VKPQNILVGHGGSIKLTNFGIAIINETVQYYTTEQIPGEIVTPAADVYSLDNVMYEMLTGHPPIDGDSPVVVAMKHIQDVPTPPSQFNPNIPAALEEIILRCLEKAPDIRYSDGSELARALKSLHE
jgi:serine/threonine protein kinase